MIISRFIHILSDNILWNAIKKEKIKISKESYNYILNNKNNKHLKDIPNELLVKNVVVNSQEELDYINYLRDSITDKQYQGLYLITTTNCNLDCDYCFYRCSSSESLKSRQNMDFLIAKKSIDKFYDIVKNNITYPGYWQQITFYGGEPIINYELLKYAVPYARNKFNDNWTDLVINTNLTLLTDNMIKLFKENNIILEVSIDGDKYIHDLHRKTINGTGTYDLVIQNAKKIVQSGIQLIPMITATDANVDNFSEIVMNILKEIGVKKFYTNILISESFQTKKDYCEKLAREMIKLNEILSKEENAGAYDFDELYEMIMGNDKSISKNSCGSTRKITVFPNGNVFACQALEQLSENFMGSIDTDFINNPNWQYWRNRNKFSNENCLDCEVVASCGGGCAAGSYNYSGNICGTDYNQCEYNKALFKVLQKRK